MPWSAQVKRLTVTWLGVYLLLTSTARSHPHGPPIADPEAVQAALQYTRVLVDRPDAVAGLTLDSSWSDVTAASVHRRDLNYFVVAVFNPKRAATLYILLGPDGAFYDANFEGSFKGI